MPEQNKYNLLPTAEKGIISLAKRCGIERVILFGSRTIGDNRRVSDINLEISGGDTDGFRCDADEVIETLLMFDIVDLDSPVQPELKESINREGIVIYEI